jgi:dihydroorotate dehydrogenase (NAD+) catalytic subunit
MEAKRLPLDLDGEFSLTALPTSTDHQPLELAELPRLLRDIAGFEVSFPVGVPASVITANSHWIEFYGSQGFDILTYKTVRSQVQSAHPAPNWLFLREETQLGQGPLVVTGTRAPTNWKRTTMTNSYGVPSLDPSWWVNEVRSARVKLDGKKQVLIVSVQGSRSSGEQVLIDGFVKTALLAKGAGAQIVEANFSCPNIPGEVCGELYADAGRAGRVAGAIKDSLAGTPLFVKIGYLPQSDLSGLYQSLCDHVDGIGAIDTISAPVFNAKGRQAFRDGAPGVSRLTGGISGHAIKPWAKEVCRHLVQLRRAHRRRRRLTILATGASWLLKMSSNTCAWV